MKAVEKKEDEKALLRQLKEKLNWYTMEASDEEYDEEAVESILCLLDRLEPVAEDAVPDVDDAWERFREMAEERGLGPAKAENAAAGEAAEGLGGLRSPDALETAGPLAHREAEEPEMSEAAGETPAPGGAVVDMASAHSRKERKKDGVRRYGKCAAAAVLVVLALMAAGDMQAGASIDTGFFHWLRRDNSGIQMITSPENLDEKADMEDADEYYDRDNVPEWAQEWRQIDMDFEMPENYEWQCFEINEFENLCKITSFYLNRLTKQEMFLGMVIYLDKVSLNTEEFVDYTYTESYEINQKQMNIYRRIEDEKTFYIICFYEDNFQFFIQGQDNLDELKGLTEHYWLNVKNNLCNLKDLCNKMPLQVIYKVEG